MSLMDYCNEIVICQEINKNDSYWETLDGSFGIWFLKSEYNLNLTINTVAILRSEVIDGKIKFKLEATNGRS